MGNGNGSEEFQVLSMLWLNLDQGRESIRRC